MASRYVSSLSLSTWECCCSRRGPRPRKPSPWRSPKSPAGQGREGGGRAGDGDLPDGRRGAGGGPVCESGPDRGDFTFFRPICKGNPRTFTDRHAPAPLTRERCSILCAAPLPAASRGGPNDRWRRMEIRSL